MNRAGGGPRVSVYIGLHKTGSTALQRAFFEARIPLLHDGVLYPATNAAGQALMGAELAGRASQVPLTLAETEPHNSLAFRLIAEARDKGRVPPAHRSAPRAGAILEMIDAQAAAFDARHVVLVSEVFSGIPHRAPAALERLAAHFGGGEGLRFVCVVRRPDDLIASWTAQRIRFGRPIPVLDAPGDVPFLRTEFTEADRIVDTYRAAFPDCETVVRSYDEVRASGGAATDFAEVSSGIPTLHGRLAEQRANPSVPHALIDMGRRALEAGREARQGLAAYLIAAAERIGVPPNREVELYGTENRRLMHARFAALDASIQASCGRGPLFPALDEVLATRPRPAAQVTRDALGPLQADARRHLPPGPVRDAILAITPD